MAKAKYVPAAPVKPDVLLTLNDYEATWLRDDMGKRSGSGDPSYDIFHALSTLLGV